MKKERINEILIKHVKQWSASQKIHDAINQVIAEEHAEIVKLLGTIKIPDKAIEPKSVECGVRLAIAKIKELP